MSYQISFQYRFESAHRFMNSCSQSCATPHGHTWYASLRVESEIPQSLNGNDMVLEFADLKRKWKQFIGEVVDHSFLHHFDDPIVASMREHIPLFRGLPFPGDPTTELLSALFLCKAQSMLAETLSQLPHIKCASVHVQETPTNGVEYKMPEKAELALWKLAPYSDFKGWWNSPDPLHRGIEKLSAK